ncbi:MAG: phytanoyl-CoA dioxygenase family protein, partial [Pseudomonadota bacterium]
MNRLDQSQIELFKRDGAIVAENAVSPEALSQLRSIFDQWVEDSRSHEKPFGEICDGRPRF